MKLILNETVASLGKMGDVIDVADGYARNYLLPKRLALLTTPRNLKVFEHTKKVVASKVKKEKQSLEDVAKKIATLSLCIPVQATEEGKLFGSVAVRDVADALAAQGIKMDHNQIVLEKPIKELGQYFIPVQLPHDISTQVKIDVTRADAE